TVGSQSILVTAIPTRQRQVSRYILRGFNIGFFMAHTHCQVSWHACNFRLEAKLHISKISGFNGQVIIQAIVRHGIVAESTIRLGAWASIRAVKSCTNVQELMPVGTNNSVLEIRAIELTVIEVVGQSVHNPVVLWNIAYTISALHTT